jgi:cyanuric acid amidohydrolase
MMMIGGVGGIMCPHINLFVNKPATETTSSEERLTIGVASSCQLTPEEFGTMTQVDLVAETTLQAMQDARITSSNQIHFVEVKCPAMTPARIHDATNRGKKMVNNNLVAVSSMETGACALGVAVATGEVDRGVLSDDSINVGNQHYSSIASTSTGGEQVACRVVVIGNVEGSPSRFVAGHGMMKDQLDTKGARESFANAGLDLTDGTLTETSRKRLALCFVNAGAGSCTDVRRRRHTIHFCWHRPEPNIRALRVPTSSV